MDKDLSIWQLPIIFIKFLRKFIVGEDWAATVIVVWGIAIVHSFSRNYLMNTWYLLPMMVLVALFVSLHRGQRQYRETYNNVTPNLRQSFLYIWIPMALVTLLPPVVFYLTNSYVSIKYLMLPILTVDFAFVGVSALCLYNWFAKQPLASSLVAVAIAILIVTRLQPHFMNIFTENSNLAELSIVGLCYISIFVFGVRLFLKFKN